MPAPTPPSSDPVARRLDHLADLCARGLIASAELELHTWRREPDCPAGATTLLAALLAQRGRPDDACRLLNGVHDDDDDALDADQAALLVAILAERGQADGAARLATRLAAAHGHDDGVRRYLATLGFAEAAEEPSDLQVGELAEAIAQRPAVLDALVAATIEDGVPKPAERAMLDTAGRSAFDCLDDAEARSEICRALGRLALACGRADDARRWAHLGLREQPHDAGLALLLADLDDDPHLGPPARLVLARALRRHPNYPDLRAAYIRRCQRDGRADSARRRLSAWLRRDPRSPIAIELQQEVAA
ncbi:MAG: hypothetical protein AAGB29_05565 [Planctomycetota bacterium]